MINHRCIQLLQTLYLLYIFQLTQCNKSRAPSMKSVDVLKSVSFIPDSLIVWKLALNKLSVKDDTWKWLLVTFTSTNHRKIKK